MPIRRRGIRLEESESEDDDDAFAAMENTKSSPKKKPSEVINGDSRNDFKNNLPIVPSTTSSMKRHHTAMKSSRKAHMEALIQELEHDKYNHQNASSHSSPNHYHRGSERTPKGSYVEPGRELETTNIFVGNLHPSLTEEQVADLFGQFGELYSVKVMWPRTAEEKGRNRHTGFVCFMHRRDAEDAMAACDNRDPFRVGRRLIMRWGKHVLGEDHLHHHSRQSSFDNYNAPRERHSTGRRELNGNHSASRSTNYRNYPSSLDMSNAIKVIPPRNPRRAKFISNVAWYVATDGSALENHLMRQERQNPDFDFLRYDPTGPSYIQDEHIYYRWRVYAFCQNDSMHSWQTEPFQMFRGGQTWIPPPIDDHKTAQEEEDRRRRRHQDVELRRGRERQGKPDRNNSNSLRLEGEHLDEFQMLTRTKLSMSRKSICRAMAFCFEHSSAAKHMSDLLRELMLDDKCSVETRIARLYLLSDVLFNSQQPGIKNAFQYRDAVEKMAPDVFWSLGKHGQSTGTVGRMRLNKIKTAVNSVLSAWTNWSVYNPVFMQELQDRFDGKEPTTNDEKANTAELKVEKEEKEEENSQDKMPVTKVVDRPKGDWTYVNEETSTSLAQTNVEKSPKELTNKEGYIDRVSQQDEKEIDSDGDIDGEPLEEGDLDEEGLKALRSIHEITDDDAELNGEPIHQSELEGVIYAIDDEMAIL